jgi:hypothetical protein
MISTSYQSKFNGSKADYAAYRQSIISFAASLGVTDRNGFGQLGHLLSAAEYQALTFPAGVAPQPFVRLIFPGEKPALTGANAATALASWRFDAEQHQLQEKAYGEFKAIFLASLDDVSREAQMDLAVGATNHTPRQILEYMDATWGVPAPSELRAMQEDLGAPYVLGSSLKAFTEQHRKVHAYCRAHGQPISDLSAVSLIVTAVTPCGVFAPF